MAIWPVATPPAFVNHLDARDEVLRVKRDLGLVSCKGVSPEAALGARRPRAASAAISRDTPSRVRLWAHRSSKRLETALPHIGLFPRPPPRVTSLVTPQVLMLWQAAARSTEEGLCGASTHCPLTPSSLLTALGPPALASDLGSYGLGRWQ